MYQIVCRICKSNLSGWLRNMIICPSCWEYVSVSKKCQDIILKALNEGPLYTDVELNYCNDCGFVIDDISDISSETPIKGKFLHWHTKCFCERKTENYKKMKDTRYDY